MSDNTPRPDPSPWQDADRRQTRNVEEIRQLVRDLRAGKIVAEVYGGDEARPTKPLRPKDFSQASYVVEAGVLLTRRVHVSAVAKAIKGATEVRTGGLADISVIRLPPTLTVGEALALIESTEGTDVAYPNYVFHVTSGGAGACPASDPRPTELDGPWPTRACASPFDGSGVRVVVVDTGLHAKTAAEASWLAGVSGDLEKVNLKHLSPYAGHGTFVAGALRAQAPGAAVRVEGFLTNGGAITEIALVTQLRQALASRPDIVSMSAGTYTRGGDGALAFRELWERYASPRTLLICAAGNDNTTDPFFPAADDYAIGVGALTEDGTARAGYSNYGPNADVYAVGTGHVNAYPKGHYFYDHDKGNPVRDVQFPSWRAGWDGTSFATPLVAGVVAARMSGTGRSGRDTWSELAQLARAGRIPGVGPVITPELACAPHAPRGCCCGHGSDRPHECEPAV